jgi:hypothetical protein
MTVQNATRLRFLFPLAAVLFPLSISMGLLEIVLRLMGTTAPVLRPEMFKWEGGNALLPYVLHPNFEGTYAGGIVTASAIEPDGYKR